MNFVFRVPDRMNEKQFTFHVKHTIGLVGFWRLVFPMMDDPWLDIPYEYDVSIDWPPIDEDEYKKTSDK
jgi:hypothetical protein